MKAARIQDGIVAEIVEIPEGLRIEDCYHPDIGFIEFEGDVQLGMTFDGKEFGEPPEPARDSDEAAWARIRRARDYYLSQTDWTQLPDVPEKLKEKFAKYRQELRDFPATIKDIWDEIEWPEAPK